MAYEDLEPHREMIVDFHVIENLSDAEIVDRMKQVGVETT